MNIRSLITALAFVALVDATAPGNPTFTLTGSDFLAVTSTYTQGILYDYSSADIQSGGIVVQLSAYDNSSVMLSGGSVGQLSSYDNSSIMLSGGSINQLSPSHSSVVKIFDGFVSDMRIRDDKGEWKKAVYKRRTLKLKRRLNIKAISRHRIPRHTANVVAVKSSLKKVDRGLVLEDAVTVVEDDDLVAVVVKRLVEAQR